MDKVEYVGYNLLANGIYPAQSKFDIIKDLEKLDIGSIIHCFTGIVISFHRYSQYLEMRIKQL